MDAALQRRYQLRARIVKAMAHPTRLFIVEQLAKRPHCVCELTKMIEADISTVSKHLAVLKSVGIVQTERDATRIYYRLRCPCVLSFFACVEEVISSTSVANGDLTFQCTSVN